MKKMIFFAILMLIISSMVFAIDPVEWSFFAYYNGESENRLELEIFDGTNKAMNAAIIQMANPEVVTEQSSGSGYIETVFTWRLRGNYQTKVTINFNFLPLQAFLNKKYYIPEHKFTMKMNETTFENGLVPDIEDYVYDKMYDDNQAAKTADFTEKGVIDGNYPYLTYGGSGKNIKYEGPIYKIENGVKKNASWGANTNYSRTFWTRSGTCSLEIFDYDHTTIGEFDYIANVTVTITVNT